MKFIVEAGKQDRPSGPVRVTASGNWDPEKILALLDIETKRNIPCQIDSRGQLCWMTGPLKANQKKTFELNPKGVLADGPRITVDESHPNEIQVFADKHHVTTYNFAADLPRPFLYPVLTPTDRAVTRGYPMRSDIPGELHDHSHHRSCWVAHGNINGENYWHDHKDPAKQARQVHRRCETNVSGQVFGQIKALIEWNKANGERQISEQRTYSFYTPTPDCYLIDIQSQMLLMDGDLRFGDTKEGGMCAVRVAGTIKEQSGGTMINSEGQKGEKEAWGKKARWVDYYGTVDGEVCGLTVMDGPKNFRHPTTWHARGYGLLTANPFGLSYFTRNKKNDGSHTFKNGETVVWNHRVLIHHGDTDQARVVGHYANFADPPKVTIA